MSWRWCRGHSIACLNLAEKAAFCSHLLLCCMASLQKLTTQLKILLACRQQVRIVSLSPAVLLHVHPRGAQRERRSRRLMVPFLFVGDTPTFVSVTGLETTAMKAFVCNLFGESMKTFLADPQAARKSQPMCAIRKETRRETCYPPECGHLCWTTSSQRERDKWTSRLPCEPSAASWASGRCRDCREISSCFHCICISRHETFKVVCVCVCVQLHGVNSNGQAVQDQSSANKVTLPEHRTINHGS